MILELIIRIRISTAVHFYATLIALFLLYNLKSEGQISTIYSKTIKVFMTSLFPTFSWASKWSVTSGISYTKFNGGSDLSIKDENGKIKLTYPYLVEAEWKVIFYILIWIKLVVKDLLGSTKLIDTLDKKYSYQLELKLRDFNTFIKFLFHERNKYPWRQRLRQDILGKSCL